MSIKKSMDGAGEMAQSLKSLDALLEVLGSILELQFQEIEYLLASKCSSYPVVPENTVSLKLSVRSGSYSLLSIEIPEPGEKA
ncbi:hypothetical protein STEG23_035456 [Scotinomys teguina]